jgi:hypothetical protein
MTDSFRTSPPEEQWSPGSTGSTGSSGYQGAFGKESERVDEGENEVGRALLVGLLGGLVSAAGYFVYRRLPEDQKERLHTQVRSQVAQRIAEIRQNFNI